MATQNKTSIEYLREAKEHVEAELLAKLYTLSPEKWRSYVKVNDEKDACHMMKTYLASSSWNFSDDDIRYQCSFIGNILHHRSRDLARDVRDGKQRVTRSSSVGSAPRGLSSAHKGMVLLHTTKPIPLLHPTRLDNPLGSASVVTRGVTNWPTSSQLPNNPSITTMATQNKTSIGY